MKRKLFFAALIAATTLFAAACSKDDDNGRERLEVINFSDLTLEPNSYWDGSDGSGGFTSGTATFANTFTDWGGGFTSWSGFGYSNQNDTETAGFGNQFSVYTATANANGIFAVWASSTTAGITFDEPKELRTADFALTTYAYLSMRDGDAFAKKFEAGDWYKITITAHDPDDGTTTLDVYLVDFRDGKTVLTGGWTSVNLSPLGTVSKLNFAATSSDVGQFGMNTPAYFCIDNISYVK